MKLFSVLFATIIVVISIFLISCISGFTLGGYKYTNNPKQATVKTIPIVVDKNFSTNDKNSIKSAISQWNYSLNGYILLNVESWDFDMEPDIIHYILSRQGYMIMKIDSKNPIVLYTAGLENALAFCNEIGGNYMYFVNDRIRESDMKYIALHEFAHLLGSPHIGNNLMLPNYSKYTYQCIDYAALKAVASYRNLPLERLNYCQYD